MKNLKFLALTLLLSLAPITKSHALVSLATGQPQLALAGLATGVGGIYWTEYSCERNPTMNCGSKVFTYFLLGFIMLDEQNEAMGFNFLGEEAVAKLGITAEQLDAYNNELEEINVIFEEVSAGLNAESTVEESQALWDAYAEALSVEAFEVMQAIASKR